MKIKILMNIYKIMMMKNLQKIKTKLPYFKISIKVIDQINLKIKNMKNKIHKIKIKIKKIKQI